MRSCRIFNSITNPYPTTRYDVMMMMQLTIVAVYVQFCKLKCNVTVKLSQLVVS